MFEDQTWDVNCPFCNTKNTLKRDDLGVMLNCGACSEPFKYDEPLKQEKAKRKAAEAKRREAEKKRREAERAEARKAADAAAAEELAQHAIAERERKMREREESERHQATVAYADQTMSQWRKDRYPYAAVYERYIRAMAILFYGLAVLTFVIGLIILFDTESPGSFLSAAPIFGAALSIAFSGMILLVSRDVLRAFLDIACAQCKQTTDRP